LLEGIGDTIRVSLTAEPEKEVEAAKAILLALGLRPGIDIISCPTCGRCNIDIIKITNEVEKRLDGTFLPHAGMYNKKNLLKSDKATNHCLSENLTIAIMGCAVNGPGEAKQADFGIAGGDGEGLIFAKGEIIKKVPMENLVDELLKVVKL